MLLEKQLSHVAFPAALADPGLEALAWHRWLGNHLADVAATVAGVDAVLILTEWQHYRQLDWSALAPLMRQPAWIFDARSVVDPAAVAAVGLQLWRVGDGGEPISG